MSTSRQADCQHSAAAREFPTARLITWWVIASEIVIFGGLLATYVMHRIGHPEWADAAAHTNHLGGRAQYVRAADVEPVRRAGAQSRGRARRPQGREIASPDCRSAD